MKTAISLARELSVSPASITKYETKETTPGSEVLRKLSEIIPVLWFGPRIEPHITDKMILRLGCDYSFELRTHHREIFEQLDSYISNIASSNDRLTFLSQINAAFNFYIGGIRLY